MKKYKTITLAMVILWVISMLTSCIYYLSQTITIHIDDQAVIESPVRFFLLIFYFFPLLLLIKKYSNLADMKKINKITKLLTPIFILFTLIAPIALLLMLIV